ncbi:hypothetical protein M9H77_33443 [Catharanthus roseus]|uniref:Uncharacterized protein n=1 Tax=Catharanthus roseus TaxID=4058 RepID=A0ACB9ZK56_CATRO|nr:hypothetical protein M9H77_33443 [Catharanthus roseus]
MASTLVFTLLFFTCLFFFPVLGYPPTEESPFPPTTGPANVTEPPPSTGDNPSVPAPPLTNSCSCSLKPETMIACALVIIQGQPISRGIPQRICCQGLKGLTKDDVNSCLCYAFSSGILNAPGINITVPIAMKAVSAICKINSKKN